MNKPDQPKDLIIKLRDLIEQFCEGEIDEEDDERIDLLMDEIEDYLDSIEEGD